MAAAARLLLRRSARPPSTPQACYRRGLTSSAAVVERLPLGDVLLLGHPALRAVCEPCGADELTEEKAALATTLELFRQANGFGRGVAAPQIGVLRRFIAVNMGGQYAELVGEGPRILSDPEVTWRSDETFTLFDDCMSLPWVLCAVRRHLSISVSFTNEQGQHERWERVPQPLSELLQHELDHLDGVLLTDRALDQFSLGSRAEFEKDPERFADQVDYIIAPTIAEG